MKFTLIGHSHIVCIEHACQQLGKDFNDSVGFVQLHDAAFLKKSSPKTGCSNFQNYDQEIVEQVVSRKTQEVQLTVLCPYGNEHNIASLINSDRPEVALYKIIEANIMQNYRCSLSVLSRYVRSRAMVLPPPPPLESDLTILKNPGIFAEKLATHGVAPHAIRLRAWLYQKRLMQQIATDCGLVFLELPQEVFSDRGLLHERFQGNNPTHANVAYGELILRHLSHLAANPELISTTSLQAAPGTNGGAKHDDRAHPYVGLPDRSFWKQAVAQVPTRQFDPVGEIQFKILRSDKVATAGSCFAQHISKRIRASGFQFLVTENPVSNAAGDGEARGFYDFSARYGNIYTARQLLQLFDRAFGYFTPLDIHWSLSENRFCDPFRPRIEPNGFASVEALIEDRRRHLAAVREMFSQLDVFIYTLGLTECWVSRLDGAAYPVAPGVAGGKFDPSKYEFVNFGVDEVVSDLDLFMRKLRLVNPKAKVILTVSPVPLAATYGSNHVLVATTYSKSVLRVAADMVSRSCGGVYYFPSFEIINGNYNRGRYFGPDLRSVTEEGVDHVMSVFMRHLTEGGGSSFAPEAPLAGTQELDQNMREMMALAAAACDEELLERR